ncbi:MFS transporter [Vibrio sinensis]|uniref:MFS transporter n=1 Tax=Vibrio sinensis TaxID=2302434 RepID=A0A3A6QQU4_9VIBR|nr:MFS transporter [Vibrio sinensis]RJX75135.1 MFS transporter [Vibrio sinensis]
MKWEKYIVEFLLFTVYLVFGASWATTGAVGTQIMQDFGVGVAESAMMTNAILWAKILGALSIAVVTYKLGIKKSYFLALVLVGTAIFIPFTDDFYVLILIRFLNGLGGAMCLVSMVPVVSHYFDAKTASKLNSINGIPNVIGSAIALMFAIPLMNYIGGWKPLLAAYGWITLAFAAAWLIFFKDFQQASNKSDSDNDKHSEVKTVLRSRVVWGMVTQYIGGLLMLLVPFTYLPTYYSQYANLSADSIAFFAPSVNQFGIIAGAFLSIWLKGKNIPYKKLFASTSVLMVIFVYAMFFGANEYIIVMGAFGSGMMLSSWFSFIFSLPRELIKNPSTNTIMYAMSTFWLSSYILATINTQIVGYLVDLTSSFTSAFYYVLMLLVVCPILAQFVFPASKNHSLVVSNAV